LKVIIIEDEISAVNNLEAIIEEIDYDVEIIGVIESIKDAIDWISSNPIPDLAFVDIQLADGSSFEIFEKINIDFPVIFTTAYDEYALKAFQVNSIDYILKPIKKKDVLFAINKYKNIYHNRTSSLQGNISQLINELGLTHPKKYRSTLLISIKDKLIPVTVADIAIIYLKSGIAYIETFDNKKYFIEKNLNEIENELNPNDFFRVNRQSIIARNAIKEATLYFGNRLKLKISLDNSIDLVISKGKVSAFKKWISF
jgi:two-component system LytT family response regulator